MGYFFKLLMKNDQKIDRYISKNNAFYINQLTVIFRVKKRIFTPINNIIRENYLSGLG